MKKILVLASTTASVASHINTISKCKGTSKATRIRNVSDNTPNERKSTLAK